MKAYWFSKEDGTTDNQPTPAVIGGMAKELSVSPTPWNASKLASGDVLWEVETKTRVKDIGSTKVSCKYLRKVNLARECSKFAAQQALLVIDDWAAPDIAKQYFEDEAKGIDRSDIRDEVHIIANLARIKSTQEQLSFVAAIAAANAAGPLGCLAPASCICSVMLVEACREDGAIRPDPLSIAQTHAYEAAELVAITAFDAMALDALHSAE